MSAVFHLSCRHAAYLLNKLVRLGVCPRGIEVSKGGLLFRVSARECAAVVNLLQKEGVDYTVSGFLGLRHAFRRVLARPFLVLSLIMVIGGIVFFENFVYDYTIRGNQYVNTQSIALVLKDNRLDGFTAKSSLDLSRIKREITAIDGISFASVKVVGTRLQVEVKESLRAVDPDVPQYQPIFSSHAAVVTKIVAESGTPRVSVGQTVAAGTMLIEPIYAFTEGEAPAPARGEVWGVVTYCKEVLLPAMTVEPVFTGESCTRRIVTLYGKPIGGEPHAPYDRCEVSERVIYRGIGVKVSECTYRRIEEKTVYHDFDVEGKALLESAARSLLVEVPSDAKERGAVRVTQKRVDNLLITVIYYTIEQRIDSLSLAP